MQIILDSQLQATPDNRSNDLSYSLSTIARTQYQERGFTYEVIHGNVQSSLRNTGLVGLLSHCYSKHLPVAIAPHDIWVLLLSEVSKVVAKNPEAYRALFTTSDKKETISVPSGSMTEMPIDVLAQAVAGKVLFDSSLVFKNFSTETPVVTQTLQAIFCDMASPYYDYMMFCCGIPSIELLGTTEDWTKVHQGFKALTEKFNTSELTAYFGKVDSILQEFVLASQGQVNLEFWKDIFTQENVGSGGDLTINGWITKLFVTQHDFAKITNFTGSHGVVKYTQAQSGQEFVAIYGGFDAQVNTNGFYQLQYTHYTLQKVPSKY